MENEIRNIEAEIEAVDNRICEEGMKPELMEEYLGLVQTLAEEKKQGYITVQSGVAGFFAVLMTYDKEISMYTPWQTGCARSRDKKVALAEAYVWSVSEGIADALVCA